MSGMADVLSRFIRDAGTLLPGIPRDAPWLVAGRVSDLVAGLLDVLPPEFERISGEVAVHRSATVASSALLTGPVILSACCQVGHGAVLRGGVWADEDVVIGPHSEIKGTLLFARSAAAHRNYVGDSIIGRDVNLEAGAVLANHFNERADKQIWVRVDGALIATGVTKFGALIGNGSRIGANAVTSPGTLLPPGSVVPRLGLVDQSGADGQC
jgi:NDP-sugar pyrophosphorylase family protein